MIYKGYKNKEKRKEYLKEYQKKWYQAHKEKRKKSIIKWQQNNKEKVRGYCKKYHSQKDTLERINAYRREYRKQRTKVDPKYHIDNIMATAICGALKGRKAGRKWQDLVGYTTDDLITHIERQFDDKMSWGNYGSYFHIDHIKPKSLFKYEIPEDPEFQKCWALENLQPLEKTANIIKSNKIILF